jgi:5-methylcytosine-specific restriction enzyme A
MARPIKNLPVGAAPLCKCGCGNVTDWNRRKNRWNVYVVDHYRRDLPYKNPVWLRREYVARNRTLRDIADEFDVNITTVAKQMRKHNIKTRNSSQAHIGRQRGSDNPAWKGGVTPERQRLYKTAEWKAIISAAFARDRYHCVMCGRGKTRQAALHAHHRETWSSAPERRMALDNLVTLCEPCHVGVHSRQNAKRVLLP